MSWSGTIAVSIIAVATFVLALLPVVLSVLHDKGEPK
jgi:MFS-type transporter involved in bile tolerance (Atg22 family)